MVPRVPRCLWCECRVPRCLKHLKHFMHQHQGTEAHQAPRHLQYSGYHVKNKIAHNDCNAANTVIQA